MYIHTEFFVFPFIAASTALDQYSASDYTFTAQKPQRDSFHGELTTQKSLDCRETTGMLT